MGLELIDNGILVKYSFPEKRVVLSDKFHTIGRMVFTGRKIGEVVIPDTVTFIDWRAFFNCVDMHWVNIPESVTKIEAQAFGYLLDGSKIEGFKIFGVKGSEAERYARENGFEFIERAPKKTYVISDLHGYPFEKFLEILKKAEFSDGDTLYILGDVVDRGEDGVKYLQWALDMPNVTLLLGNHEKMMRECDFLFDPDVLDIMEKLSKGQRLDLSLRMANGAKPTVEGLFAVSAEERAEIYLYLCSLPLYKLITVGEKEYLLVHSGLRDFKADKPLEDYKTDDLLWERPALTDRYYDDIITVFGHTPSWYYGEEYEGNIIFTDTWIDIDAGAGAGLPPVLLRLEDMKQFTLEKPN